MMIELACQINTVLLRIVLKDIEGLELNLPLENSWGGFGSWDCRRIYK